MKKLLANRWQTPDGTILWSKHRHDFACHKDKNGQAYIVDGGNDYIKKSINTSTQQMKNLCIYDDGTFKLQREWVLWGRNYDKNMNLLPKTEYIPIKDLETNHIYKILELELSPYYRRLFEDEILFRCGEKVE